MSLRTERVGTSTAQPRAVQWWCSFLVLGLLCAGCAGGTARPQVSNSAPLVSITSPTSGATVSGTITITTNVSANTTSVQFSVDGSNVGAAVTSAPFSFSLNTTTLSNGSHSLTASASTLAGQTVTSVAVSIKVNNAVPPTVSITSPTSGATVSGTITITTNVSANTTSVQFSVDGSNAGAAVTSAPFSFPLNTTTLSNGVHSLTATASNASGQTTTSAAVAIKVNNAVPPTISITSPTSGATVSGTITITTNVSANTTSVQFSVDGSNAGAAVTSAPFSFPLNTTTLSNGVHSLTATASNASGQTTTSAAVAIKVNNAVPPTVSITSPTSGATVSGTITITTNVSANTTSVQFSVDGSNVGAAATSAPFSFSLNTTTLSNGVHSLTATASNTGGQTTTSAAVAINVNNPHLQITTSALPGGQAQVSYSATLQASGGTPPYTWAVRQRPAPQRSQPVFERNHLRNTNPRRVIHRYIGVNDSAGHSTSTAFSINISTVPPPSTVPFGHVIVVVEENTNYSDVIGNSSAPYMNSLANQYGLATNYYANTHPSIGNYFMLTTGQILTNDDSQTPLSFPISADNVVRELLAAGKTWKAYAESIPSVGYVGGNATGPDGGFFYTRHVPLPYMTDVQNSTAQRQNIVPFTQFAVDLANDALPSYSFITPNGCDDAHDCSLSVADSWLNTNIGPLISSALFQKDGLLIIVFDESNTDNTNGGGQVPAIVISPFAKLGFKSTTFYQHESILRLMLEGLGVTTLPAAAASAPKMWEFFTFAPPT